MGTIIRAELSNNSDYYIPKHRYYELKHFCLQYNDWKKELQSIRIIGSADISKVNRGLISNPTAEVAMRMYNLSNHIDMVEKVCDSVGREFSTYLLKAVTEGYSYAYLQSVMGIPCCRSTYYTMYRYFFWKLSKKRE